MARLRNSSVEKIVEVSYKGLPLQVAVNFRTGRKGALFFIHGLGCSKDSYKDVWNFSELEHFSVVTCDLVGFGNSSRSKGFSYSMEVHAEICKIIIEELNLDRIHVVGHSMGGVIGLLMIEKIPEKVAAIRDKIRTIPISESGHFMMVENPQESYQKLGEIIRD